MIERKCAFLIGKRQFTVEFPNVGQLIDIESLKQALTNNRYGAMASSGVASMYEALDFVDAISFLQVCAPDVARFLDVKSYSSLTPEQMKDIFVAYKNTIKPWMDSVSVDLKNITKDTKEDE